MRFPRLAPSGLRRRQLAAVTVAGVAAALTPAALATTPAAAAPRTASPVVSPKPGEDVTRHRVKIVVRAGDEHGDLSVTLNGRQIGRDFARGKRGLRTLRVVNSHGLRHGRNVLRVRARRGHAVRRATVRFKVTRRLPLVGAGRDRTVTVGRPARMRGHVRRAPGGRPAGKVRWRVVSAPRGSRVSRVATPPAGRQRARGPRPSAAATAPDALQLSPLQPLLKPDVVGTYTLQVTVGSGANATVDTVQYSAIPADPLVPIDMQVAAASSSTGVAQPGLRVGATTYRMAYMGYENGAGRYDSSGDCCTLGQFFAMWQVVALDRSTLQPLYNRTYGFCQVPNGTNVDTWRYCRSPDNPQPGQPYQPMMVNPADEVMRQAPGNGVPGALVLGRTLGTDTYAGTPENYDAILDHVGYTAGAPRPAIRQPASFVGVPGMQPGEADISAPSDGELPGYLTADQSYQYHYLSSIRPQFDTRSTAACDANACTVAQTFARQEARATVPRGHGGYLISGWDPVTGALRSSTFATIDGDDPSSRGETQRMLTTLQGLQNDGSIVAITTLRTPGMPTGSTLMGSPSPAWNGIADLVAALGGTKNGFLRTVTDPNAEYTMVGWRGAGEDGGNEAAGTGESARLRGAFAPNRQSLLRPANVSSVGPAGERIGQLMVQPTSTAWRYPDASTGPGAVIQCIGAALGKGVDFRAEYTELLTQASATALQNDVRNLTIDRLGAVPGTGLACRPAPADFTTAQSQLVTELGWVSNVRGYLTELSTPEAAKGGAVWGQTLTLGQELQQVLDEENQQQELTADALGFVATLLDLVAPGIGTVIRDAERITTAVTVTAGTFWLASEGIERAADGGPDLDPDVQAIDLAAHLQQKAQAATSAFTQIGDVLISDPTKLEEVGRWAGCTPNVPGGCPAGLEEYAASGADVADLTNVSLRAMGRSIYETLVTQTYPTWDTGVTQYPGDPYDNYYCVGTSSPFGKVPPSAYSSGLDSVDYGAPAMSRVYLMIRSNASWGWPPQAVTDRMFGATGDTWDKGGLGMDPLTVMRNSTQRFEPGSYSCSFHR